MLFIVGGAPPGGATLTDFNDIIRMSCLLYETSPVAVGRLSGLHEDYAHLAGDPHAEVGTHWPGSRVPGAAASSAAHVQAPAAAPAGGPQEEVAAATWERRLRSPSHLGSPTRQANRCMTD